MIKKVTPALLSLVVVSSLLTGCGPAKSSGQGAGTAANPQVITIKAQTLAPEVGRVDNIQAAASKLNEAYKKEGKYITVKVEKDVFQGGWDEYRRSFILASQSGKAPDIWVAGHEDIGWLAKNNYVLPLDDAIKAGQAAYSQVFDSAWNAAKYNGKTWGIPQDIEARPVYFRKDVLHQLGWSDEKVAALPAQIKKGEFTLDDMITVAAEAKQKGLVEFGILHRPKNGLDFVGLAMGMGAQVYDNATSKLVFDKQGMQKTLAFFEKATKSGAISKGNTQMEWNNVLAAAVSGKSLFYWGGSWNWAQFMTNAYDEKLGKVSEDYLNKNMGYALYPAATKGGKPFTLSHPLIYTVSAKSQNPDVAKKLLELATDPDLQVKYAVETGHLVVMKNAVDKPDYQKAKFLQDVTYMLDYTNSAPNHPDFNKFNDAFFKAIQAIELGEKNSAQAQEWMEQQIKADLGPEVIIK